MSKIGEINYYKIFVVPMCHGTWKWSESNLSDSVGRVRVPELNDTNIKIIKQWNAGQIW